VDEQFEKEIKILETGGWESSSVSKNSYEDDECWKCASDSNQVEWGSDTLIQRYQTMDEVRKMRYRQGIHKLSLVEKESDVKEMSLK